MTDSFRYIFGPVHSWRLGSSLGVDPLTSHDKICNMDCVYCQLGKTTQLTYERKIYVELKDVLHEISRVPLDTVDHITFSGRGEPTLALNLGELIRGIKKTRPEKVAVLTNSSLMDRLDVRDDLMRADFVLAKIDAGDQLVFEKVVGGKALDLKKIVEGIKDFRRTFKGKLALQIMLIDDNFENIRQIAQVARSIGADEVELDTPLRPCGVKPLNRELMQKAKTLFADMPVVSVYDLPHKEYTPMDERATIKRHGNFKKTTFSI
ncbi:MAG: radical SAM protein [Candidatus Omnitrophica bacterium]|nr:radical SAM protein [Candidatus Omnitrophota bacterium]